MLSVPGWFHNLPQRLLFRRFVYLLETIITLWSVHLSLLNATSITRRFLESQWKANPQALQMAEDSMVSPRVPAADQRAVQVNKLKEEEVLRSPVQASIAKVNCKSLLFLTVWEIWDQFWNDHCSGCPVAILVASVCHSSKLLRLSPNLPLAFSSTTRCSIASNKWPSLPQVTITMLWVVILGVISDKTDKRK